MTILAFSDTIFFHLKLSFQLVGLKETDLLHREQSWPAGMSAIELGASKYKDLFRVLPRLCFPLVGRSQKIASAEKS